MASVFVAQPFTAGTTHIHNYIVLYALEGVASDGEKVLKGLKKLGGAF
jgi:hypothetical protein